MRKLTQLLLLLLLSTTILATTPQKIYIQKIEITNEIKTDKEFALSFLSTKIGDQFNDSVKDQISTDLLSSNLFSTVTITPHSSSDSVKIELVLDEKQRYYLSSIGGGLNSTIYGEETKIPWINFNAGATHKNLFGKKHEVTIYGSVWRIRYIGGEWLFPVGRSGFYAGVGSFIGRYPSMSDRWLARVASNSFVATGKKWEKVDIRLQLNQNYRKMRLIDEGFTDNFWETLTKFEFTINLQDRDFNPKKGFKSILSLTTNSINPYENESSESFCYLNSIVELRFFTSPFTARHIFGLKLRVNSLPVGNYSRYDRLYIGGVSTVRGFLTGSYGGDYIYKNYATATVEYRPHLWRIPSLKFPFLSWYNKGLSDFPIDIDGTIFVDAGRLWKEFDSPFASTEPHKTVASAGTGIRILVPTIQMSGTIDIAWPIYAPTNDYFAVIPTVHIYANFPF